MEFIAYNTNLDINSLVKEKKNKKKDLKKAFQA